MPKKNIEKSTGVRDIKMASPSLSGKELILPGFKDWIRKAENTPSITLEQAKQEWASKRKKLEEKAR